MCSSRKYPHTPQEGIGNSWGEGGEKSKIFRGVEINLQKNVRESIDTLENVPTKAVEQKKDRKKTVRGNLINGNHREREKRSRRYNKFAP